MIKVSAIEYWSRENTALGELLVADFYSRLNGTIESSTLARASSLRRISPVSRELQRVGTMLLRQTYNDLSISLILQLSVKSFSNTECICLLLKALDTIGNYSK